MDKNQLFTDSANVLFLEYLHWQIIHYIKTLLVGCYYTIWASDIHRLQPKHSLSLNQGDYLIDTSISNIVSHSTEYDTNQYLARLLKCIIKYIRLWTICQRKNTCWKGCNTFKGKHFSNPIPPSHTVCVGMSNTQSSCCNSCWCPHTHWLCNNHRIICTL